MSMTEQTRRSAHGQATKIGGKVLGYIVSITLVIFGATTVFLAAKVGAFVGFGVWGIVTWFIMGAVGLAVGALGILGLMLLIRPSKARH